MKDYKIFIRSLGLVGLTNLFVSISAIILLPLLTKILSVDEYGIWVQITVTVNLIPSIATFGLSEAMVRFLSPLKDKKVIASQFYSIILISALSSLIIAIVIYSLSSWISICLFNNEKIVVDYLATIIFFACLNYILLNYFRTFNQIKLYSTFNLILTYLTLVLVAYALLMDYGIMGAVLGLLITHLILFITMLSIIIFKNGITYPSFTDIREYLSFGLPTIPGNLSYWAVNSADRYIISFILGTSFVGYYSSGYALGGLITMLSAPLSLLLPAILPKYYENKNTYEIKKYLSYSFKYYLLISIPALFGISILSFNLLIILTTTEIAAKSYLITPIVALGCIFLGLYVITSQVILLKKKTKIIGILWVISSLINIIFNFILIPTFGIIAAGITTTISFLLPFIYCLKESQDYLIIDIQSLLKYIFASFIMIIPIFLINPKEPLEVIIIILISSIFYLVLLILLKSFQKSEIDFILGLFFKK